MVRVAQEKHSVPGCVNGHLAEWLPFPVKSAISGMSMQSFMQIMHCPCRTWRRVTQSVGVAARITSSWSWSDSMPYNMGTRLFNNGGASAGLGRFSGTFSKS